MTPGAKRQTSGQDKTAQNTKLKTMNNEKVPITASILNTLRDKYPSCKDMTDEKLIEALLSWENQFEEIKVPGKQAYLSRNLVSSLAFPTFNEFALFHKTKN